MRIDSNMKRRLLAAIAVGELDLEKFPELVDACKEASRIRPITKETARKIINELGDE